MEPRPNETARYCYRCGCVNERHEPTGALRCVRKCHGHRARGREPRSLDASYYSAFGLWLGPDAPPTNHVAEITEALGEFERPRTPHTSCLEIGCGVSPYVNAILDAGWLYEGLDPSEWATRNARSWGTIMHLTSFENFTPSYRYGMILAAHSLEHMPDAPAAVHKMSRCLAPGGHLYLVIPDDTDPLNPDHLWFFDINSLSRLVSLCGMTVDRITMRHIVAHENFIYCKAYKP